MSHPLLTVCFLLNEAGLATMGTTAPASAAILDVTYTGLISSGFDTSGLLAPAGSLVGDAATISLAYDLSQGTFSSSAGSSSFLSFGPASGAGPVQASITVNSPSRIGGLSFSNSPNGVAVDQATAGTTNQSISLILPQFNETFSIIAFVINPSIPASILQPYTLKDIDLAVAFSFTGGFNPGCTTPDCNFNAFGNLTHGDLSVSFPSQSQTPLPAALPLFATGLAALGLIGWRRKRKASALA